MRKLLILTVTLFLLTPFLKAEEVNLKVNPDKVLNRIDEKVYGQFLEHIYHSVNGGLWGELVWNRSFEDNNAGQWKKISDENGGVIAQLGNGADQRLVFGDENWGDYEFTVDAKKTGGAEGFLILFRAKNKDEFYWINLGGWGNRQHGIERRIAGQGRQSALGRMIDGKIDTDKWYKIKVRCEGAKITVFLDDEKIFEQTDETGHRTGQVGVGTWETQAEFRNLKVESLDGKTLHEGTPQFVADETASKHWETFGDAKAFLETGDAKNGENYQRVLIVDGEGGIQQKGFSLKKGETYVLSFWYKYNPLFEERPPMPLGAHFLYDGRKRGLASSMGYPEGWQQLTYEIPVDKDTDDALLQIYMESQKGETSSICIDQVSVMPKSWKEKFGGFRPDLLNAIAELAPPTIRWPGGCFASAYRWKSGIGPQEDRVPYPFSIWDDREVNSLGTDEFIELCHRVGSEPIIVVNAGTPGWNKNRNPELANVDWPQEAADWVEYCNGSTSTKWGKLRAENGHPAPYKVKYWEIDNEVQGGVTVQEYIEMVRKMVAAMKKVDPSIKIIVSGTHYGPRLPWDQPLIEEIGDLFDYLSFHQYDDPNRFADGPEKIGDYFRQLQKIIAKSKNPNIKIFDSEWNAQSTDWR
ncbi:MAG: family 16 glycoside hydrolase, partial [Thermoguttaceae bacterium]